MCPLYSPEDETQQDARQESNQDLGVDIISHHHGNFEPAVTKGWPVRAAVGVKLLFCG